jgi:hypothetical protein
MSGMYYFNCNGPVQVGPYANYNEALADAEQLYGGPCQFLSCDSAPCGAPSQENVDPNWKPDEAFLEAAAKRPKRK